MVKHVYIVLSIMSAKTLCQILHRRFIVKSLNITLFTVFYHTAVLDNVCMRHI